MMKSEPHEGDPNLNIVLRSGMMTRNDNRKKLEDNTFVRKALAKEAKFHLEHAREALMEAKKSFVEAPTSGRKDKPE